jgi:peptide/nickel transport system permease protein
MADRVNAPALAAPRPVSLLAEWARLASKDPVVLAAVCFLLLVLAAAVGSSWLTPFDPKATDLAKAHLPPSLAAVDGDIHLLGTDHLGRDLLSRIMLASRVSVSVGLATVLLAGSIGVTLGLLAGFFGGVVDDVIMRLVDLQLGFPPLLIALIILFVLGGGIVNLIVTLALIRWAAFARMSRALGLGLRTQEFVEAAKSIGCSSERIIFRHILPNASIALVSVASLEVARMILAEASLSFLGLGIQPPDTSWGAMLGQARDYIRLAWWTTLFPGLAIVLTTVSVNIIALGTRTVDFAKENPHGGSAAARTSRSAVGRL